MKTYNGHRSWSAWNVSLWINNDESLYRHAYDLAKRLGIGQGASALARDLEGQRTPDGAQYNPTNIRLAMRGIL